MHTQKFVSLLACSLTFACGGVEGEVDPFAGEELGEELAETEDATFASTGGGSTIINLCDAPAPHATDHLGPFGTDSASYTRPAACQSSTVHQFWLYEHDRYCPIYTLGARHVFTPPGSVSLRRTRCEASMLALRVQKLAGNGTWETVSYQTRYARMGGGVCSVELGDEVRIPMQNDYPDAYRVRAQAVRWDGTLDPVTTFGDYHDGLYAVVEHCE